VQYTADAQDSCSALALEAQPWRGNGSENGWRHAVSHAISIHSCTAAGCSQLQLYDWHPDEFSDVLPLIRPTIYEQDWVVFTTTVNYMWSKRQRPSQARPWYDHMTAIEPNLNHTLSSVANEHSTNLHWQTIIYVRFSLVARPTILLREDQIYTSDALTVNLV